MKKLLSCVLFSGLVIGLSQAAFALPLVPAIPADGPLYIKFNNYEQINTLATAQNGLEQNWGILDVSTISRGSSNDQLFGSEADSVWANNMGGEITGIFYGIKADATQPATGIASTGGFMDLYYDSNNDFSSAFNLANRTADDKYIGATEGTLLAHIEFVNGAISTNSPTTSIVGTTLPVDGSFAGFADSFGSVLSGAWAPYLDNNFFNTLLGNNTADLRFKNSYNYNSSWGNGTDGIYGATSDDPARANAVPEPATMLLFGLGLVGLAGFSRKRKDA